MRADVSLQFLADQPPESTQSGLQGLLRQLRGVHVPLQRVSPAVPDPTAGIASPARQSPESLFSGSRCPEGACAGLLLFAGHWSSAHELVDDLETPDGCYWHALIHRMEPDIGNSDYWFRQVGQHPLFPSVLDAARRLAAHHDVRLRFDQEWNPTVFNGWCEAARENPQAEKSLLVAAIHSAECHLLWNYSLEKVRD